MPQVEENLALYGKARAPCTRPMPKFSRTRRRAGIVRGPGQRKEYFRGDRGKDYWVMHCLWADRGGFQFEMKGDFCAAGRHRPFSEDIDIRFEPPATQRQRREKPANVKARLDFFDGLAARIKIPGIEVERNRAHDHRKAMNGGIGLKYPSHIPPDPALKSEVLLEIGFHQTAPNEPRDFTSWALDKALSVGLDVVDNSAKRVKCFNPEYTFVDKLQTICRFYRQHRDGKEGEQPPPRIFRAYQFLSSGRRGRAVYQQIIDLRRKLKGPEEFASRDAFTLPDPATCALFEAEFKTMGRLLLAPGPTFEELAARLREFAPKL